MVVLVSSCFSLHGDSLHNFTWHVGRKALQKGVSKSTLPVILCQSCPPSVDLGSAISLWTLSLYFVPYLVWELLVLRKVSFFWCCCLLILHFVCDPILERFRILRFGAYWSLGLRFGVKCGNGDGEKDVGESAKADKRWVMLTYSYSIPYSNWARRRVLWNRLLFIILIMRCEVRIRNNNQMNVNRCK
jgi:hypothetical protein